ncbi:ATP-binding cassette domain-containing protein [Streptomyces sp. 549]|uniref:ATP-binding cassette domain-containing protein n=1 Tax=Streptomyces sp. 549 TaxID=3049076 RepID=UPI0024C392E1|nr:ATP-binding cassette domain-containing protein [Streptomyces sp. 549]MDK1476874.1 ATP-binding cassette domain-containing protein [Streptomyces sp. 549]
MDARTTGNAIVAEGLRKEYGDFVALDGLDLTVPEGTVCGLLGPNGAGKTTAVRILCSLLRPDGGRASAAGFDILADAPEVRYRIGLTGQSSAVDEALTGRQNLMMFSRLYHLDRESARARADELLGQFSLTEVADKPAKTYSGGMRRRLDLAASFIMAPQVLFLDEPTTGLDPRHRTEVWEVVRSLVGGGTTVLLTSHYLDEVDQLADNIVVVDRGKKITEGTPEELKSQVDGDRIDTVIRDTSQLTSAAEVIRRSAESEPEIDVAGRRVSVSVRDRVTALSRIARSLEDNGIPAQDIALRRPTLDEVFMRLTGDRDNGKAEVDR